jgi:dihydrofolate synthase/folylpolyglutamate synthase
MKDKALAEMATTLFPVANELILTKLDNPRAATEKMLMAAVPVNFDQERVRLSSSVPGAVRTAHKITQPDGLICVTGSLYLVGTVQEILN